MRISFGGRHLISNQETLDEFVEKIVPRTRESASTKTEGYSSVHKLRVNLFLDENASKYAQKLDSMTKELHGEIDLSFMVGRGPGVSFKDLLLQRDGDITVLYGAEDMDINQIQPEVAWMAGQMVEKDLPLGVGCRPQVMLHTIPEADLMRQIHEAYYAIAAGANEEIQPENPFNHDLSKGSSIFVGQNGEGGLGDITSGLSLFNHTSSKAQDLSNYFSLITSLAEPEMFTSEYALHIEAGIENIFRAYTSYNENRFYDKPEKSEFTEKQVAETIEKMDKLIINYNTQLANLPRVYGKVRDALFNPKNKKVISNNLESWLGFSAEEFLERVDSVMRKGLLLNSDKTYSLVSPDHVGGFHIDLARFTSKDQAEDALSKWASFTGHSPSEYEIKESYEAHPAR